MFIYYIMNTYVNLFFLSFIDVIFRLIYSNLINNISNIHIYMFIIDFSKIISIIYLYCNKLTENEITEIFSNKYSNIWIYSIAILFYGLSTYKLYVNYEKEIGIANYEIFTESIHIILIFMLSYFLFNNTKINKNIIVGIILTLCGLYMIINNK